MKKLWKKIREWLKELFDGGSGGGGGGGGGSSDKVPSWRDCKYASCWDGANASKRMMNILSPKFSDQKFRDYVDWMKGRGCDTAHVILMNKADGEGGGYTAVDNPALTVERLKYLRSKKLAVVEWIITDDSPDYAKKLFSDPEKWVSSFDVSGILKYASYVVLGLEMDEPKSYGSSPKWKELRSAIKAHCPNMKIGVHHKSGNSFQYASLGDIVLGQLDPGCSESQVKSQIKAIKAKGKEAVGFEYERNPNRKLAKAALDAGAFSVGNW